MFVDCLFRLRLWRSCLAVSAVFLSAAGTSVAKEPGEKDPGQVADLRYGVALFHYFQQDYFSALSELQVAQEKGGIQGHGDNAGLIEAGIQLSFGMDRTASELFADLAVDTAENKKGNRSTAWYYLAKLFYQRGDWISAREHLDKIDNTLPESLQADAAALDIQLLIREEKFDEAEVTLAEASRKKTRSKKHRDNFTPWRPYLAFNLASRYVLEEKTEQALPLLNSISEQKLSRNENIREEQLVMADKANTATGYSYFENEQYDLALASFGSVRQLGDFSSDALLGYGWSAARLEDYPVAISAWQQLRQRNIAEEAVQESWLATPYAHLQLGLTDMAIEGYQQAEMVFEEQLKKIDAAGEMIASQSLVDLLDLENTNADYNWLQPETNYLVKPQLRSLLELFSLNRFQYEVQNVRDLFQIQRRLQDWQQSLDAYDDLLEYRRQSFRLQNTTEGGNTSENKGDPFKEQQYNLLVRQYERIKSTLDTARTEGNVYIFLDETRADQLELIESAEANIKRLQTAGEDVSEEQLLVKRYRGALEWSASQDFDARLWEQEAKLKAIASALQSSRQGSEAVKQLLTEAPDISRAKKLISDYSARVDSVLAKNRELMDQGEAELRQQIYIVLAEQRQQLQFYLSEARLAVAQIYDNIYLGQDNDK